MKRWTVVMASGAVAAGLAAMLARGAAQAPPSPAPTRVGVCDVVMVFNNYERAKELSRQFDARADQIKNEDKKRAEAIEKLKERLDALAPASKEYNARLEELEVLADERAFWLKMQEQKISRERRVLTEQMYGEILQAVADVAKERAIDVVLYREGVEIASQTTGELLNKIALRKCLYAHPSLDLTETVLERVNRKYASPPK